MIVGIGKQTVGAQAKFYAYEKKQSLEIHLWLEAILAGSYGYGLLYSSENKGEFCIMY